MFGLALIVLVVCYNGQIYCVNQNQVIDLTMYVYCAIHTISCNRDHPYFIFSVSCVYFLDSYILYIEECLFESVVTANNNVHRTL